MRSTICNMAEKIPSIEILATIAPDNAGTGEAELIYNGLAAKVDEYAEHHRARVNRFWERDVDSIPERGSGRQLAFEFLARTACQVVHSTESNHDLWANRFTEGAIELFGKPDKTEVAQLVRKEYDFLTQLHGAPGISLQHVNFLLDTYRPLLAERTHNDSVEADRAKEQRAIVQFGTAVRADYQPLFDLVDASGKATFTAEDLHKLFTDALGWLEKHDDTDWGAFKVVTVPGTTVSVDAPNKRVKIASRREAANSKDTKGVLAHELLVHARRAKNGYKTGIRRLATGIAGYTDAEEGLGILMEEAITGELPAKASDRYVDVALALGTLNGEQMSRHELFQISFARQLLRAQFKSNVSETDLSTLRRTVWSHVDRIYRGGKGGDSSRQAVFTKDIAYYVGYKKMAQFITKQIDAGASASEVFAYLSQAKFDPTDPKHLEMLPQPHIRSSGERA